MRIESIKLINFRQYRNVEISFSISKEKSFNIIQGITGAGKTNLLNAITWCLYGKEKHLTEKYKGYPILNNLTENKMRINEKSYVGVEIRYQDEYGKRGIIKRAKAFKKNDDGKLIEVINSNCNSTNGTILTMVTTVNNDYDISSTYPEILINQIIPESIERYFFFDGERLNDYFAENSGDKIREAVYKLSQIGLITNSLEHLIKKKNNLLKDEKLITPGVEIIREELENLQNMLDEKNGLLEDFREQKNKAIKIIREYSEKLRHCQIDDIKTIQGKREELIQQIEDCQKELREIKKSELDYVVGVAPMVYAYRAIGTTKDKLDKLQLAGEIPPNYKKEFIQKLLDSGKCICAIDISENNIHRENVKKLLEECDDITNNSAELIENRMILKNILTEIEQFPTNYKKYVSQIRNIEDKIRDNNIELKKINEKLENVDINEINDWNSKIIQYTKLRDQQIGNIAITDEEIKKINKNIKDLNFKLQKELNKEEKYAILQKKLLFCDESIKILEKIKNEIVDEIRKEIERETEKQFLELIWKKNTYSKVKIGEDYEISLLDNNNIESIGTLSAGETQILAFAFIGALNAVSGFHVPIIIDTPLGRISLVPRLNIVSNLHRFLSQKQIILLFTDEEYSESVREKLIDRSGKEYEISFKESEYGSEVEVIPYGKKST